MIAASATTTASTPSVAVPGPAPETAAPVDFMALLLLLTGVGAVSPQAEGQDQRPAGETTTGLDVSAPADSAMAPQPGIAGGAALALLAGGATQPFAAMGPDAPASGSAGDSHVAGPAASAAGETRPDGSPSVAGAVLSSLAAPASGERAEPSDLVMEPARAGAAAMSTTATESPRPAPVTTPTADEDAGASRDTAVATAASPAGSGATAARAITPGSAGHGRDGEREATPADRGGADAPAPRPVVQAMAPRSDVIASAPEAERSIGAEDGRPLTATGAAAAEVRSVVVTAHHAVAAEIAPAAEAHRAIEPRAVAEQVVRAARLVVEGGESEMHVELDPPALGAVRVSAEARGASLELTIAAERPETQALLVRALPEIRQALADRGVESATVNVAHTPVSPDGRRAPERRAAEPRERHTPHPGDRRRAAPRRVSAVDITV